MDKPRHKRGDVREDGKVFWCYKSRRIDAAEVWVTTKQFESYRGTVNKNTRAWRTTNADKYLNNRLNRAYGISLGRYNSIIDKQGGGCAICGRKACPTGMKLAVDHCHETGEVRGVLCSHCNTALGKFQDSPELLKKGIDYLRRSSIHGRQGVASAAP